MSTNFIFYDKSYRKEDKSNISSYFTEYKKLLALSNYHEYFEHEDDMKSFRINAIGCDMDDESYDLLADYCSVDKLTVDDELSNVTRQSFEWENNNTAAKAEDVPLLTLKHLRTIRSATNYYNLVKQKHNGERQIIYKPSNITFNTPTLAPESDILVYVRVYHPYATGARRGCEGVSSKLRFSVTIEMHGSQTLDMLRDQIKCISDHSISLETSAHPINDVRVNAKHLYKSGFFYIENTFYNDCRDPTNKDYSKNIREWAEAKKLGCNFQIARMETTPIGSLVVKFGFPWLYLHQGDCEHLICFSNARFVSVTDEINANCYPRIQRIKPKSNHYCMTCGVFGIEWFVVKSNRLPHNPSVLCNRCFKSYNYVKGKKIGSFLAYPYPRDADLLQPLKTIMRNTTEEGETSHS